MLGPNYSYADELRTPSELGIGRNGSFDGIMRAVAGVNYYVDAIGFGQSTMLAKNMGMQQSPLGLRFFVETGAKCSNTQPMYEYVDMVPSGLPGRAGGEIKKMLGVDLRGMAPGIMEDAAVALNPKRLFDAAKGGYARCKKVTLPVGDAEGNIKSRYTGEQWITGPVEYVGGKPHQTFWVLDKYISAEEYDADAAAAAKKKEGFVGHGRDSTVAAGVLFAAVCLGTLAWTQMRS
jgi:hypothetical protein